MGIINVTPDSFSDGGRYSSMDDILFAAEKMAEDGAFILDIGGESTRPGYVPVSSDEEAARVIPVIEALKTRIDIPISLDTSKSVVLKEGISAGIDFINDIWGLRGDLEYSGVVAGCELPYIMANNRHDELTDPDIDSFLLECRADLEYAAGAGIDKSRIIYDPGIGFAKSQELNLSILKNLDRFAELKTPVLIGASRKSVIGYATGLELKDRSEATMAITAACFYAGIDYVRVHEVQENARLLKMLEAMS